LKLTDIQKNLLCAIPQATIKKAPKEHHRTFLVSHTSFATMFYNITKIDILWNNFLCLHLRKMDHNAKPLELNYNLLHWFQRASVEAISSSAHQSGESLGTADSGVIFVISRSLSLTSFIVGLCFGSGCTQDLINAATYSS